MFKFNFLETDAEDIPHKLGEDVPTDEITRETEVLYLDPSAEVSMDELIKTLPPILSYTPLHIPIVGRDPQPNVTLIKRDLFDARFQLISQEDGPDPGEGKKISGPEEDLKSKQTDRNALDFVDTPSDLVPGVYEGGLKTWECSLDLVNYLESSVKSSNDSACWITGKKILEIGCGTAIPSLYLLQEMLASAIASPAPSSAVETTFHLQDYNRSVLELVTFPNVLLTWYASPLSQSYRTSHAAYVEADLNPTAPGELHIESELISAFIASLRSQKITIRFFSGSWDGFPEVLKSTAAPYDITLTSETIYRISSLPSLVTLLRHASTGSAINNSSHSTLSPHQAMETLSIESKHSSHRDRSLCLIAAKVLYFGVGGGVAEFERLVGNTSGDVRCVQETQGGVGRKVMHIDWH